jgi:hypothetical protein
LASNNCLKPYQVFCQKVLLPCHTKFNKGGFVAIMFS